MPDKAINDKLKKGIESLKDINEVKVLQNWQWNSKLKRWFIKIATSVNSNNKGKIPDNLTWYVVVGENYPEGIVKIYPDANSEFNVTFEHQANNGEAENELWRKGSLCLESPLKCLGRYDFDLEPMDVEHRLWWNVQRAIDWIHAVNDDTLVEKGDPFELPEFNIDLASYCVFSENESSFNDWQDEFNNYGIAGLSEFSFKPSKYFVKEFRNKYNKLFKKVNWGNFLSENKGKGKPEKLLIALWVMLKEIPVINYWQAPNFYGELFKACEKQGIDLKYIIINELAHYIRDGDHHILLLGFPIPKKIGGKESLVHWQAIKLPVFTPIKESTPPTHENRGRRRNKNLSRHSKGSGSHDRAMRSNDRTKFTKLTKIEWIKSQNWDINEITNRGRLSEDITSKKILIIGIGTLGASIAELLARSAVPNISILDNDKLEIGNLSRHPLTLTDIGKNKTEQMEKYLNLLNPHIQVTAINGELNCSQKIFDILTEHDLIIDCTGEANVLKTLNKMKFENDKILVSFSIGIEAKRLYLSLQSSKNFKLDKFYQVISPWIKKEKDEIAQLGLPRDGIGCWSSIFPARYDDILLASSTALKVIEEFTNKRQEELNLIFIKRSDNGNFGYELVE